MALTPDDKPDSRSGKKPSRSGAHTQRSSDLIGSGGKLDPRAIRSRLGLSPTGEPAAVEQPDDAADPDALAVRIDASSDDHIVRAAEDDAPNRVVFVLQRDLQKRLDKYLTDRIPFMSRTQLQRLIDEGGVSVNARPGKASTKLRVNDRVEVFVPPPPPTDVPPQDIPIRVMFEDDHLLVLNKQPDIIVHPARSELSGTLINALAFHFKNRTGGALSAVGKEFARPGVVHRLDRNTSGCIVFAKTDEAHWQISRQFELRTVDKRYLAITHGHVEPEVDVIDLPLGPHPSREKGYREKYVVRHDHLGKPSVTIARVRAVFTLPHQCPVPSAQCLSLVELELKTGRTHQIRVHLSHTGFPIVADDMYGGRFPTFRELGDTSSKTPDQPVLTRHALHAATLAFRHPITKEPLRFTAPFPDDMHLLLATLRAADTHAAPLTPPGATVDLSGIWPGEASVRSLNTTQPFSG